MKTSLFLAIIIVSGFSAGLVHGLANLVVVEPYLDKAISIENQNRFASGEIQNTSQFWKDFGKYREWQKESSVLAGGILGLATGSLFGLVFAYSKNRLPSKNTVKKALLLGGLMWLTLFFIPFLKYPANPPTVGNPDTVEFREITYAAFVALSGFGALGFVKLYGRLENRKFLAPLGYFIYIGMAFLLMPQNPDKIVISPDLVNGFRLVSLGTMTLYWFVNASILGFLWKKFQPDEITKQT